MTNEELSADEMDCLLNGAPDGEPVARGQVATGQVATGQVARGHVARGQAVAQVDAATDGTVLLHPASSMNDTQQRNFQAIHEVLAERASKAWSQKLRGKVDVGVTKVGQSKFGEFAFGLDNPTCFLTLDVEPLDGHACLEIHPTVLFPMIDRLLGGGKKAGPIVRRPLTDIERRLLGRIAGIFFEEFRVAWKSYAVLQPEIKKIESNPKLSRCIPAADSVETIEFEVRLPFARGPIRMAYPSSSIVAVHDNLTGDVERPFGATDTDQETAEACVLMVERTLEPNAAEFELSVGDLIDTGVAVGGFAELHVNGQPEFKGHIGQHQGTKAFLIEDIVGRRAS